MNKIFFNFLNSRPIKRQFSVRTPINSSLTRPDNLVNKEIQHNGTRHTIFMLQQSSPKTSKTKTRASQTLKKAIQHNLVINKRTAKLSLTRKYINILLLLLLYII